MIGGDVPFDRDRQVRLAAFAFLEQQTAVHGDVLSHRVLSRGFEYEGTRVPLLGPQGIFKPAVLPRMPLSITTVAPREGEPPPYDDGLGPDGLLRYRYRGTDPRHRDNVGLRLAMERHAPLVYNFGVSRGEYVPVWPVYVVGDDPTALTFTVDVAETKIADETATGLHDEVRRAYVTRVTIQRLHQRSFRQRVLAAYHERCAMCRLRHVELLDAAHILPDSDPRGEPIVPNGLALCTLHHAAFDRYILGVRPDLIVEVRQDVLNEVDGPTLRHGLQSMEGVRIQVPRSVDLRPREEFLEERYRLFRNAS